MIRRTFRQKARRLLKWLRANGRIEEARHRCLSRAFRKVGGGLAEFEAAICHHVGRYTRLGRISWFDRLLRRILP